MRPCTPPQAAALLLSCARRPAVRLDSALGARRAVDAWFMMCIACPNCAVTEQTLLLGGLPLYRDQDQLCSCATGSSPWPVHPALGLKMWTHS